jgi:capsular polysaccharide biosynthesis protein
MNILNFDLKDLPKILLRYFFLLLGASLIAAYSTYYLTSLAPPIYEAKARLLVGPKLDSPNTDYDSLRIGGGLVQTYAELAKTHPILQIASDQLNLGLDPIQMDALIDVRSNNDTRIISIITQHQNPDIALGIANSISESILNLSPSSQEAAQPGLSQLQFDIGLIQQSITDTQVYIEALEAELESVQKQTQDISFDDMAHIQQFQKIEDDLSLERSRLSNAIRDQGANFSNLNSNTWTYSSDARSLRLQFVIHIEQTENLILNSTANVERLESELERVGKEFDTSNYFLTINLIDRQNDIRKLLSEERSRLVDQTRAVSQAIDTSYSIATNPNPNQIAIIESADTALKVNDLLELKVVSSAVAGLIVALVIVILIETLFSSAQSTEKTVSADDVQEISDIKGVDPETIDQINGDPKTDDPETSDLETSDLPSGDPKTDDLEISDLINGDPKTDDPKTDDPEIKDQEVGDLKSGDPKIGEPETLLDEVDLVAVPADNGEDNEESSAQFKAPFVDENLVDTTEDDDEDDEKIFAHPKAIELAEENGIDLYQIIGTGKNGRILVGDVNKLITPKKN